MNLEWLQHRYSASQTENYLRNCSFWKFLKTASTRFYLLQFYSQKTSNFSLILFHPPSGRRKQIHFFSIHFYATFMFMCTKLFCVYFLIFLVTWNPNLLQCRFSSQKNIFKLQISQLMCPRKFYRKNRFCTLTNPVSKGGNR